MKVKALKEKPDSRKLRIRIRVFGFIFLILFGLLGLRAFNLHLEVNPHLSSYKDTQYQRKIVLSPKRGNILDANHETLAMDVEVYSIYASPHLIEEPKEFAKQLAPLLQISSQDVLKKISNKKKKFVWLKRRVEKKESEKVRELDLEGIGLLPEYKRFYPNNHLAANLIGIAGYDAKALEGMELSYDSILKNKAQPVYVEKDAKGRPFASFDLLKAANAKQIVLTLDKYIQHIAEKELDEAVKKANAKSGVAIVLEAKTGSILAMAVSPSYNPNDLKNYQVGKARNRAIADMIEPGSTFKAFTAAIALENKAITPQGSMNCENGRMKVGKHTIKDTHPYGMLSLRDIIKYSSNICSYKLAQKVGKEKFIASLRDLGFGQKTGIQLPGEIPGLLDSAKNMRPIRLGNIGFGQGVTVTPLQIALAYGAIANGGYLMKPRLVKDVLDSEGNVIESFPPQEVHQVFSPEVTKITTEYLKSVVEKGGTGTRAAFEDYGVAGKTGTAQKTQEGRRGYAKHKYVASFVGFAPTHRPELVVVVSIDEPKGAYYGGVVSAPVFKNIMGQSLAYLKISPEKQDNMAQEALALKKMKEATQIVTKKTQELEKEPVKEKKEIGQASEQASQSMAFSKNASPDKIQQASKDSENIINDQQPHRVPTFTGLSVREVLRKAQQGELEVKIEGSGICYQQNPEAGRLMKGSEPITVECHPPI
ncbi:MAG: transpeptidase family protein [Deltaproteobacteria bacterium]|nr:transpeptidase family protein [Deltaproteobacteria bacterium]